MAQRMEVAKSLARDVGTQAAMHGTHALDVVKAIPWVSDRRGRLLRPEGNRVITKDSFRTLADQNNLNHLQIGALLRAAGQKDEVTVLTSRPLDGSPIGWRSVTVAVDRRSPSPVGVSMRATIHGLSGRRGDGSVSSYGTTIYDGPDGRKTHEAIMREAEIAEPKDEPLDTTGYPISGRLFNVADALASYVVASPLTKRYNEIEREVTEFTSQLDTVMAAARNPLLNQNLAEQLAAYEAAGAEASA